MSEKLDILDRLHQAQAINGGSAVWEDADACADAAAEIKRLRALLDDADFTSIHERPDWSEFLRRVNNLANQAISTSGKTITEQNEEVREKMRKEGTLPPKSSADYSNSPVRHASLPPDGIPAHETEGYLEAERQINEQAALSYKEPKT